MSDGEIRAWLRLLHKEHGWPWETLGRTLGIGEGKHVVSKVRGNSWIYDGERRRISRQLVQIISGQLVPSKPNQYGRRDAVMADNPQPIKGAKLPAYDLKSGRIVWRTAPLPKPALPSFRKLAQMLGARDTGGN